MEKKERKNSGGYAPLRADGASVGMPDGVKGFLIVECCACGKQKAFFVKKELNRYECTCGQRTKLVDMVPVYMRCECGKSFRYLTNIEHLQFTANCPHCGSPVELELGNSGKAYITMGQTQPKRRKR